MNPAEILGALSWRDGLDFVLLLVIIYLVLRLLQGTRAVPILVAVGALAGLGFAARALDLVSVAALLEGFLEYVIIILIVVFHQELRRMLVRLGQRLLPRGRREVAKSTLENLEEALGRLQEARVGALLLLEGEIDVEEAATDKGRELRAPLQPETVVALALPHAANTAHDGAMLLREFRVERVGLLCPLSLEPIDPHFGTRHRAALGISEETDALAIVLSEERGDLRLVHRGRISDPVEVDRVGNLVQLWFARPAVPLFPGGGGQTGARERLALVEDAPREGAS